MSAVNFCNKLIQNKSTRTTIYPKLGTSGAGWSKKKRKNFAQQCRGFLWPYSVKRNPNKFSLDYVRRRLALENSLSFATRKYFHSFPERAIERRLHDRVKSYHRMREYFSHHHLLSNIKRRLSHQLKYAFKSFILKRRLLEVAFKIKSHSMMIWPSI